MRFLLTGGGTGGHVYPALAIGEQLAKLDPQAVFLYVGVRGRAEEKLVPAAGIPLRTVSSRGFPTSRSLPALARFAASLFLGMIKAFWILCRWKPDVIVGTGGYASAPVVFANMFRRKMGFFACPVLLHEQNAAPGRLNRYAARWASLVAVSYPSTVEEFPPGRASFLGYPIRAGMIEPLTRGAAREKLGVAKDAKVVLVFGGSLGARALNKGIVAALPALRNVESLLIIHATGKASSGSYDPVEETRRDIAKMGIGSSDSFYRCMGYLDPISDYLAAADLVVCRAGAGSLSELCAFGKPALLVPKANLPGDHQVRNALALQAAGAAEVLYEVPVRTEDEIIGVAPPQELARRIACLLSDESRLKLLGERGRRLATPHASRLIAEATIALAAGESIPSDPRDNAQWPSLSRDLDRLAHLRGGLLLEDARGRTKAGSGFSQEEQEYLAYRTDGYLASPRWEERNIGIKLVGLLGLCGRISLIAAMVYDRKSSRSLVRRMLGLEFKENDFVRRNCLVALGQVGIWNNEVREALMQGLADAYFEIRTAAARAAGAMATHVRDDAGIMSSLEQLVDDPRFEVRSAALEALGETVQGQGWATRFTRFFLEHNWKVRKAALTALQRLSQRGVLSEEDISLVEDDLQHILLTSTDFRPLFDLKQSIAELSTSLRKG